ncbi:MAG: transposase [Candidatus Omnitrophota bacterium]
MGKAQQVVKKQSERREYDSAWKEILEEHFETFLEFFFEDIHRDIDFSKGYESLSKELIPIARGHKLGKRLADVLIKVHLKDGSDKFFCVFIHIEVQGKKDPNLMVRIYIYNYRIFDRYRDKGVEVVSLAILTDEDENYRPDEYTVKHWGFEHRMKIPIAKIIDYKCKQELIEKLETSTNPMAMVVKAQLRSYEAKRGSGDEKYRIKYDLLRQCIGRGYTRKQTASLLKFIDWLIMLPEGLDEQLTQEISKLEEGPKMRYVTSFERVGRRRGIEEGLKTAAIRMINNGVSPKEIVLYTGLTEEEVRSLMPVEESSKNSSSSVSPVTHNHI